MPIARSVTRGTRSPWQLVWSDEFEGVVNSTPDSTKWVVSTENGFNGSNTNNSAYIDAKNTYLDGSSNLVVQSLAESIGGTSWSSGQICTRGKFSLTYGAIEWRMQLPVGGGGVWPALWLSAAVGWPPEIDVGEWTSDMSNWHTNYHYGGGSSGEQDLQDFSPAGMTTGFHIYRIEWDPGEIRWYFDGALIRTSTSTNVPSTAQVLLIDTYLGGSWAGSITASFPQYMYVDYVRVYKRS